MNTPATHRPPRSGLFARSLNYGIQNLTHSQGSVLSVPSVDNFLFPTPSAAQRKPNLKKMLKNLKRFNELETPTPIYQRLTQISPLET
jgi:hypothetical protein